MAQKTKPESKKSRMRAYQCGTTLMSLVISCTPAPLLLSLGKKLSFNKKKQKTLKPPSSQVSFLCFNRSYFSTLSEEKPIARAMASF